MRVTQFDKGVESLLNKPKGNSHVAY